MLVFPREEAARQRVVDGRVQRVLSREREVLDLELPVEQVVEHLGDGRRQQAPRGGEPVTTTAIRVYPPDETQDIIVASSQLVCSAKGVGLATVYPVRAGG